MEAVVTPEIEWSALAPIGVVVATALLTLVLELFLPPTRRTPLIAVGLLGLALAAYFQLAVWQGFVVTFGAMVVADSLGSVLGLAVLGATALTLLVSEDYLQARGLRYGEFYPLVLFASAGALAMLTTTNLMVMFIGLEMLSLALYVLSGLSRMEARSEESALKYFLLGAFASAFLLYGIALLYGAQGTVDIRTIALSTEEASTGALLMASAILILIGLAFKASLVPFHLWTPDVYQGAPTVATAYMSAVAKVAAFGVLIRLTLSVAPALELWGALLWWLSMLSMLVGNAAALVQRDAKRMLAYSSIAHAGYLTVGLASANATGVAGMIYYLVAYSLMTVGAFAVLSLMARAGDATTVDALQGLYRRSPFAAHAMAILLLSLAGIPPTAGFWGKWYLFFAAVEANQWLLAGVLALTSVVGAAYYLRLVFSLYAEPRTPTVAWRVPAPVSAALLACVLGLIGLGVLPASLTDAARHAARQVMVELPADAPARRSGAEVIPAPNRERLAPAICALEPHLLRGDDFADVREWDACFGGDAFQQPLGDGGRRSDEQLVVFPACNREGDGVKRVRLRPVRGSRMHGNLRCVDDRPDARCPQQFRQVRCQPVAEIHHRRCAQFSRECADLQARNRSEVRREVYRGRFARHQRI